MKKRWEKVVVGNASKPTLKNVSKNKVTVTIKKVSNASGYEVVFSTSSSLKGKKTISTNSLKMTLNNLKKGKTYYIIVRAYRYDSQKKKVYGKYSGVQKVTIKK